MSDVTFNDILIVDDDQATVDFLISALRDSGYPCYAAYDGGSAFFAIKTVRPALVLLDLHLPDLTGLDVVAQLHRQDLAEVPVVLMTADVAAANQLPTTLFPEYLLKPFTVDSLLTCVARYASRRGRQSPAGPRPIQAAGGERPAPVSWPRSAR